MSEQDEGGRENFAAGSLVTRSIEEFVAQMRGFTERARGMATGAVPGTFALPRLPSPPGAMSAAQLRAIDRAVKAQRQQIQGMVAQMQAFDEQLAVFEQLLDPLVEWSTTWARLEGAVTDLVRAPGPGTPPAGEPPAPR